MRKDIELRTDDSNPAGGAMVQEPHNVFHAATRQDRPLVAVIPRVTLSSQTPAS